MNRGMEGPKTVPDTDLHNIKLALAGMTDAELGAVIDATHDVPEVAPSFLEWLESACVWQMHRRCSHDYELRPPEATIPAEEDAVSIDGAIALRATFAHESPAVRALFDALVALLTGEGDKQ